MIGQRRKNRFRILVFGFAALCAASGLALYALQGSVAFFVGPSQLIADAQAGDLAPSQRLRLGGLVVEGSIDRSLGETVRFEVTDEASTVPVTYTGVTPDLFIEGQSAVAEGYYRNGVFEADLIMAKHDEEYTPVEVQEALERSREAAGGGAASPEPAQQDTGY